MGGVFHKANYKHDQENPENNPNYANQMSTSRSYQANHEQDHDHDQLKYFLGYKCYFISSPSTKHRRICHACMKKINGSFYHCKDKRWDLHQVCCLELNDEFVAGNRKYILRETGVQCRIVCHKCKQHKKYRNGKLSELSYVTIRGDYRFHVPCLMKLYDEWKKCRLRGHRGRTTTQALEVALTLTDFFVDVLGGGMSSFL